jgi:3'-5' exonuclease
MFKTFSDQVWAFDAEWIPDIEAGRRLYGLSATTPPREMIEEMWRRGGATPEDPRPYLKTALCRVISISAVIRKQSSSGQVKLELHSLPRDLSNEKEREEREIIGRFLNGIGRDKPRLVGFNSGNADLKILVQRGVIAGVTAGSFAKRPLKPWEGIDYFVTVGKGGEYHVDLVDILGGNRPSPSLHELCVLSGIPGKLEVSGDQVADLWLDGRWQEIVDYNECDALSTYLLYLRVAYFGGFLNEEQYNEEQGLVEKMLQQESETCPHLGRYLAEWCRLRNLANEPHCV